MLNVKSDNIKKKSMVSSDMKTIMMMPYTITEVVYCLFDMILKESLPGPSGSRTVVESARRIKWSVDEKLKFWLSAVAAST